jgi:hypothetical protein
MNTINGLLKKGSSDASGASVVSFTDPAAAGRLKKNKPSAFAGGCF